MANLKFSQFELRTDQAQVEALVGYDGLDNIQIDPNLVGTKYDLTGVETATNQFTITLTGSDSTADNVVFVGEGGISIDGQAGNEVSISRTQGALLSVVGVWKNLFGGDPGIFGDTLEFAASASASDTGTFPTKTWDGNVSLTAGEIINISGVENGAIGTDDAEMELCLIFEIDL